MYKYYCNDQIKTDFELVANILHEKLQEHYPYTAGDML